MTLNISLEEMQHTSESRFPSTVCMQDYLLLRCKNGVFDTLRMPSICTIVDGHGECNDLAEMSDLEI